MTDHAASRAYWERVSGIPQPPPVVVPALLDEEETTEARDGPPRRSCGLLVAFLFLVLAVARGASSRAV